MYRDNKPSEQLPSSVPDYSDILGKTIHILMDRPLGSRHPRHPEMVYPVNYGYVEGIIARDGADQDVYLLGVDVPVAEYTATVIAVYHRFYDIEDKWIAAPAGMQFSRQEILNQIHFTEQYFEGELYCSINSIS